MAWSHVIERGNEAASWLVPADYHRAIRQDGVLLRHGAENEGAKAFLAFLAGSEARTLIRDQGYPDGV